MRFAPLAGIALSLILMGIEVARYQPLLAMPGGFSFVARTAAALLAYLVIVLWVAWRNPPGVRPGTFFGLIAAGVLLVHLVIESFIHTGAPWDGLITLAFMLASFLLWGLAGYRASQIAGKWKTGPLAAAWSAMVTMSIHVACGLVLEFYIAMPKPQYVATWDEFHRSGWTDVHAFTIANTIDSALSHLVIGPLVGILFGSLAALLTVRGAASR